MRDVNIGGSISNGGGDDLEPTEPHDGSGHEAHYATRPLRFRRGNRIHYRVRGMRLYGFFTEVIYPTKRLRDRSANGL
jgi:hypothetical protein